MHCFRLPLCLGDGDEASGCKSALQYPDMRAAEGGAVQVGTRGIYDAGSVHISNSSTRECGQHVVVLTSGKRAGAHSFRSWLLYVRVGQLSVCTADGRSQSCAVERWRGDFSSSDAVRFCRGIQLRVLSILPYWQAGRPGIGDVIRVSF